MVLQEGQFVGSIGLQQQADHTYEIKALHIASAFRGQGYGALLLKECIREARFLMTTQLTIKSHPDLDHAITLYESMGFVKKTSEAPKDNQINEVTLVLYL